MDTAGIWGVEIGYKNPVLSSTPTERGHFSNVTLVQCIIHSFIFNSTGWFGELEPVLGALGVCVCNTPWMGGGCRYLLYYPFPLLKWTKNYRLKALKRIRNHEYSCLPACPSTAIRPIKSLKLWKQHMVCHYEGSNSCCVQGSFFFFFWRVNTECSD